MGLQEFLDPHGQRLPLVKDGLGASSLPVGASSLPVMNSAAHTLNDVRETHRCHRAPLLGRVFADRQGIPAGGILRANYCA